MLDPQIAQWGLEIAHSYGTQDGQTWHYKQAIEIIYNHHTREVSIGTPGHTPSFRYNCRTRETTGELTDELLEELVIAHAGNLPERVLTQRKSA